MRCISLCATSKISMSILVHLKQLTVSQHENFDLGVDSLNVCFLCISNNIICSTPDGREENQFREIKRTSREDSKRIAVGELKACPRVV